VPLFWERSFSYIRFTSGLFFNNLTKRLKSSKSRNPRFCTSACCRRGLLDPSSPEQEQKEGITCLEAARQDVSRKIDTKSFAELLDVLEGQFLVGSLVGSLPVLLCPEGLAEVEVAEPAHEGLTDSVQLVEGGIPHLEDVDRRGDDVQCLPATVESVNNGKPPILALLGYLEQLSVVSGVGSGSEFLNILYGYYETQGE